MIRKTKALKKILNGLLESHFLKNFEEKLISSFIFKAKTISTKNIITR